MSPRLFGSSGIRGLTNVEVTPLLGLQVGAALASQFKEGLITVGRDVRIAGEMLESALIAGITSCAMDTKLLGVIPTPVVAYLTKKLKAKAGVAISASHNPPEYIGMKIFDSSSMAYTEKKQSFLEDKIKKRDFVRSTWQGIGQIDVVDARSMYLEAVSDTINLRRRWNVVCDLFNGATCEVAPEMLEKFGLKTNFINIQNDGYFPAGIPEPTPQSLKRLGCFVKAVEAEIGFGFDGDGDRMIAVDEKGFIPSPDRVLTAFAAHLVRKNGGGVAVTHIGTSMCFEEMIQKVGGKVVRTPVGDVSIAEAIQRHNAVFGGEPVGAWIHPEVHLCSDGLLSALKLLEALEVEGKTLSEFILDVPEYPLLRSKVSCPNARKAMVMVNIAEEIEEEIDAVRSVSNIDGTRLQLDEGWILIRPSGTEPIIRVTVEAINLVLAKKLMKEGRKLIMKTLEDNA